MKKGRVYLFLMPLLITAIFLQPSCNKREPAESAAEKTGNTEITSGNTVGSSSSESSGTASLKPTTGISIPDVRATSSVTRPVSTKTDKTVQTTQKSSTTPQVTREELVLGTKTIEFIGRFLKAGNSYKFSWSGSKIIGGFEGSGIAAYITLDSDKSKDYVKIQIDNNAPFTLEISKKNNYYTLANNLKSGYHWVSIEKCTEGTYSTLSFGGFDYLQGKAALSPARKKRRIEIIGDSISAGYGNIGANAWTGYKPSEQDATLTYGALAAKELNAEACIIAVSGQGLYQNLGGQTKPVMKDFYDRTLANDSAESTKWNFTDYIPDVVVINLGTNDFASGVKEDLYKKAYLEFLEKVRSRYPKAFIVCCIGPINAGYKAADAIQSVVNTRRADGDKLIDFCLLALEPEDNLWGVDGHPSEKAHRMMAKDLAAFIKEKMNW